jgi:hypothetical protein
LLTEDGINMLERIEETVVAAVSFLILEAVDCREAGGSCKDQNYSSEPQLLAEWG